MKTTRKVLSILLAMLMLASCLSVGYASAVKYILGASVAIDALSGGRVILIEHYSEESNYEDAWEKWEAIPDPGYKFAGWYCYAYNDDGELEYWNLSDKNPITLNGGIVDDLYYEYSVETLYAKFERTAFTVTVSASPANAGSVTGGGTFNMGDKVEVSATAAPGYYFSGWYKGDERVATVSDYGFNMGEKDLALTARFESDKNLVDVKVRDNNLKNGDWYFDFSAWVDYMVTLYNLQPSSQEEAEDFFGQGFSNGNTLKYDTKSRSIVAFIANDDNTTTVQFITSDDEAYLTYKPFIKQYKDTGTPDNPGGGNDQPTNTNPDNGGQSQGKVCKYCGEVHKGFPGVLIGFFHSILALFGLHK